MAPVHGVASLLVAVLLLAAGCGGASRKSTTTTARTTTAESLLERIRSQPRRLPVPAPARGCSTAVAAAQPLSVRTALERASGAPFGVAATRGWSFVDVVGGRVAVFSDAGFVPRLVRTIDVPDDDAVGSSLTPDGRYLLVADGQNGATVVTVARAETGAPDPVLGTLAAPDSVDIGQGAIEVTPSTDGAVVWVTARESDQLLAFSASALRRDPSRSLLAAVRVGEAPVGLAIVDGGRDIVVADSNRFEAPGASTSLAVVNASAALAHRPAVVGTIATGAFPREMALEPSGNTLLVGDFGSDQLQAVAVNGLP